MSLPDTVPEVSVTIRSRSTAMSLLSVTIRGRYRDTVRVGPSGESRSGKAPGMAGSIPPT